ncbi:SIR2 [Candida margitis]|uniref:SIR2 n=1 Tax=Candida margitis TaxID=1775924 RepID=UPI0022268CE5|nr:SIR2 [Candida margitis]KAI5968737.1 SIR2 [Candida margitis]
MNEMIIIDSDSDSGAPPPKKFKAVPVTSTAPKTKPFEGVSSSSSLSSSTDASPSPSPSPSIVRSGSEEGYKDNKEALPKMSQQMRYPRNGHEANQDDNPSSSSNNVSESDSDEEESEVDENSSQVSNDSEIFFRPVPPKEIEETRRYLKTKGRLQFLQKYLPTSASGQDIIKIVLKLGFIPKNITYESIDLSESVQILNRAMEKVRSKRDRLDDVSTYQDAIDLIRESKRIIVITGAGISTSLGIPDFRSSKGFYSMVKHLGLSDPQEVFDLDIFMTDPTLFYSIAHMILPPGHTFSPLHSFIQVLQSKNKLLRNYTQNIDNIESYAGIRPENLIQCHGSFAGATCVTCGINIPGEEIFPDIRKQELPRCKNCEQQRKRLLKRDEDCYISESYGVYKPDITFFGEALPRRFHDNIGEDISNCDLLISIGTSLKVAPVADIVDKVPHYVPQILINKDPIGHCNFDVSLLGYCDEVISFIANQLGEDWKLPHKDYDNIRGRNGGNLEIELIDANLREYKVTSKASKEGAAHEVSVKENVHRTNAVKLQQSELNSTNTEGRQSMHSIANTLPDGGDLVDEGMKVGAVHWKDSLLYVGSSTNGSSQPQHNNTDSHGGEHDGEILQGEE